MGGNSLVIDQMTAEEIDAYREHGRRRYHKQPQTERTLAGIRRYNELRRQVDPERHRAYQRTYLDRCWESVRAVLGSACVQCGATGPDGFLDVDHIHNDGHREKGRDIYPSGPPNTVKLAARRLKEGGEVAVRGTYQLLCPNCHRLKTLAARAHTEEGT